MYELHWLTMAGLQRVARCVLISVCKVFVRAVEIYPFQLLTLETFRLVQATPGVQINRA